MFGEWVELVKRAVGWFNYFKAIEVIVPFAAAMAAAWWLQRKFKQEMVLLTGELRHAAKNFDASVKATVHQVQPDFVAAAGLIDQKHKQFIKTMDDYTKAQVISAKTEVTREVSVDDTDQPAESWAEMQAIWRDVKEFLDGVLVEALEGETRGRAAKLAAIRKTNYDDVIIGLFNYGWLGDEESDIALAMSGIYKQHKNQKMPVTVNALRNYRSLGKKWLKS
jgi:hypothetical protein